jgi:peptide/nickel transport system substrate-binding protein
MSEEGREAPDGQHASCEHANPPGSRFCDVCGVRLAMHCPSCQALNRGNANFCSNCGIDLREPQPPAPESWATPTPAIAPELAWLTESGDVPAADELQAEELEEAERLEQIKRSLQGRDRTRRTWVWLAGTGAVIGLLAAGFVLTRGSTPTGVEHPAAGVAQNHDRGAADAVVAITQSPSGGSPAPAVAPAPRRGGELTFVVPAEPPSYDAHREETFALIHPAAPHYNTLLRIDPSDKMGSRVVGDLATSWTVSPDKRTYVLKLRRGVKFHDGSEMTSRDVRATYQKIINPPPGVTSARKGEYLQIETVQAPEPYVIAFKLKWPSPSFIHSLASPWNWIYKADILERDVHWYEKNIMGTGPFTFVEHVKGSHWVGRQNPQYWDRGKPYLHGYRALFIRDDAAQAEAIRAERAHIQFRGFSPAQRDDIVRTLGEKVTVQESPWNCGLVVAINHERWPFHDRRVRRALSLALDRHKAADTLSKTAIVREVAGVQIPRSLFATPAAELAKLAGYGPDIGESRTEARRLLKEAGIVPGFAFELKNRNIPMPYMPIGTWLVDQWQQIGLKVRQEVQESRSYFKDLRSGNFDVSTDFQCGYVIDPDLDLYKFQSQTRSDANYGRYTDPVLDDLYVQQSRAVDPEQRRRLIRAFEKRLLDQEAHYIYTLQWHRIVPHSARVHGWTITPSHYLNNQLDTVWLAE